jgi:catechol 2,3-dioxygenase-like lactoylglutathione lyase family enzyme
MELKLHHVNIASDKTLEMDRFYRDVLGLRGAPELEGIRVGAVVKTTTDKFVDDGRIQFHLAWRDADLAFRSGHVVNPVERGHLAFRTPDIEQVKAELTAKGVPFSDYGIWAMSGWYQIFFHDPSGQVVEIFQADDEFANPPVND